jgi:hypothetical protein
MRLKPSKSVGVDDIPGFIIKGCTNIFVPVLKHIFNISLSRQYYFSASCCTRLLLYMCVRDVLLCVLIISCFVF